MCDDQCAIYGDCCEDSKLRANISAGSNSFNFSCITTAINGYVYMKASCPISWEDTMDIQENCQTTDPVLNALDVWIFTPVIQNGIVYKNMFCAFCHGVKKFEFWDIGFNCSSKRGHKWPEMLNSLKPNDILHMLKHNETFPGSWEFTSENDTYYCSMYGKFQTDSNNVRYCIPSEMNVCNSSITSLVNCPNDTKYTDLEENLGNTDVNFSLEFSLCFSPQPRINDSFYTSHILNPNIMKVPRCHQIPEDADVFHEICQVSKAEGEQTCFQQSTICLLDRFFHLNDDIMYLNNETIYIKTLDISYPESEYLQMDNSTVYVCGHDIPLTPFQAFLGTLDDWMAEIMLKISMICLLIHLFIFQQLPQMKNLSGKNLASLCATLLVTFFCFDIGPRLNDCQITAIILHYSWLSCFTWSFIMSYDCWRSVYLATKQFQRVSGGHSARFSIYVAISCIIPLLIVGVALYVELSPSEVIGCDKKLGYGKYKQCFISVQYSFITFFVLPVLCILGLNISFVSHTAFMIYFSKRFSEVNPNNSKDFIIYLRLTVIVGTMMSATWTISTLFSLTNYILLRLMFIILKLLNMSQGILIFFAFTFKKRTLEQLLHRYRENPRIVRVLILLFVRDDTHAEAPTCMSSVDITNNE